MVKVWLSTAYVERDPGLIDLKTDFQFDSLRSDPRFAELVWKIGLASLIVEGAGQGSTSPPMLVHRSCSDPLLEREASE